MGVYRLSFCILISGYENPERAREWAGFAFVHDAAMILPPQTSVSSRRNMTTIILRSTRAHGFLQRRWPWLNFGYRPKLQAQVEAQALSDLARAHAWIGSERSSEHVLVIWTASESAKQNPKGKCLHLQVGQPHQVACKPLKTPPMRSHLTTFGMRSQIGTS